MDACLELLLPQTIQLNELECTQPTFTWGGVVYPQGPERKNWGEFVELVQTPIAAHLHQYLPAKLEREDWVAFSVRGNGLDMLESEVNGFPVDWRGKSLESLLRLLLSKCNRWVLVFELHCDQIDSTYTLTVEQCIDRLKQNLRSEVQIEGFVGISPRECVSS